MVSRVEEGQDEVEAKGREDWLTCCCSPWYTSSFRTRGMSSTTSSKLVMYLGACGGVCGIERGGGGGDAQRCLACLPPALFLLPFPQALIQVAHDSGVEVQPSWLLWRVWCGVRAKWKPSCILSWMMGHVPWRAPRPR